MQPLRDAGRMAGLALAVLLLGGTAWLCLVGGAVALLARPMGAGLALLTVGGALLALLVLVLLVAGAVRPARRPLPVRPAKLLSSVLPRVMVVLARPTVVRGLLVGVGLLLMLAALAVPERMEAGEGDRSS